MRIGEVARAAGTTPRAVRHYHRLGLLAEPARLPNGYRDYALADLARLMRIRWLANNGIPLGSIAALLAVERTTTDSNDIQSDLRALVSACEHDLAQLTRKHGRVTRMLRASEQGSPLTALPEDLVTAFDRIRSEVNDEADLRTLAGERDLLEVFAISGNTADELFQWFTHMLDDPDRRQDYRRIMRRWAQLKDRSVDGAAADIETLAHDFAEHLGGELPPFGESAGSFDAGATDLTIAGVIPDAAQRAAVFRAVEILTERGKER